MDMFSSSYSRCSQPHSLTPRGTRTWLTCPMYFTDSLVRCFYTCLYHTAPPPLLKLYSCSNLSDQPWLFHGFQDWGLQKEKGQGLGFELQGQDQGLQGCEDCIQASLLCPGHPKQTGTHYVESSQSSSRRSGRSSVLWEMGENTKKLYTCPLAFRGHTRTDGKIIPSAINYNNEILRSFAPKDVHTQWYEGCHQQWRFAQVTRPGSSQESTHTNVSGSGSSFTIENDFKSPQQEARVWVDLVGTAFPITSMSLGDCKMPAGWGQRGTHSSST